MKHSRSPVTILDVAKHAEVSKSTVSLVLTGSNKVSEKSKQKILNAIKELGYVYNSAAGTMRSGRTKLVAIVIDDLTQPLQAKQAASLELALDKAGFQGIIVSSHRSLEQQQRNIQKLQQYNLAALIIYPVAHTSSSWLTAIAKQHKVLTVMREVPFSSIPGVFPDYKNIAHKATTQLIAQGATHIALMSKLDGVCDSKTLSIGVNTACQQHRICEPLQIQSKTALNEVKSLLLQTLAQHPKINGVVCEDDDIAAGVMAALQTSALSHNQLQLVSCMQLSNTSVFPFNLTSAVINTNEIAQRSVQVMHELFQTSAAPLATMVNVNFQLKESNS